MEMTRRKNQSPQLLNSTSATESRESWISLNVLLESCVNLPTPIRPQILGLWWFIGSLWACSSYCIHLWSGYASYFFISAEDSEDKKRQKKTKKN